MSSHYGFHCINPNYEMPMLEDQSCLSPPSDLTKYVRLQPFHLCDCDKTTVLKQAQIISPIIEHNTRIFQKPEMCKR